MKTLKSKFQKMFTSFTKNKVLIIEILIIMALCLLFQSIVLAQNVGINNPLPHAKAMLDVTSSDKGLLIPRLTETEKNAMFPAPDATAKGMMIYQTTGDAGIYQFNGILWEKMITNNSGWSTTGNQGLSPGVNFLGTTDSASLVFKVNNSEKMRITPDGKIGIGTTTPGQTLSSARLAIEHDDGFNSDISIRIGGSWNTYPTLTMNKHRGTLAAPTMTGAGDWTAVLTGRGYDGASFRTNASIIFGVDSAVKTNYVPGNIIFSTNSALNNGEKMRINRNGFLGLGTNNPQYKFDVQNDFAVGRFTTTANPNGAVVELKNTSNGTNLLGAVNFNDAGNTYPGQLGYHPDNGMTFKSGLAERMRLTPDGKLAIGMTTPFYTVDIENQIAGLRLTSTNSNSGGSLYLRNASPGQPSLGSIYFGDATAYNYPGSISYNTATGLAFQTNGLSRMYLTPAGKLGIGVTGATYTLQVLGSDVNPTVHLQNTNTAGFSGIHIDNYNNSGRTHIGFGNNTAYQFANIGYAGTVSSHPFILTTGDVERVRITPAGDVGIKTNNPGAELEVNGFTKLGSTAPAIKMIEISGTTSASQGGSSSVPHGLTSSKIVSVDVLVEYAPGNLMPYGYEMASGYHFNYYITTSSVVVVNLAGVSGQILSKPIRVLITYKE